MPQSSSRAFFAPASASAQASGQINGTVTDATGGVLPGVTVEATNTATGVTRSAISGADGLYTLPLLQPGNYNVKASLQGFRSQQRDGVRVTVTETARLTFQLEIGGLTETTVIVAEVSLVETSNATHGIVIDEQKVVDLPLNGRNFTQLGTLIPGVVAPPGGLGGQAGDATPGGFGNATGGFNVNGMRNQSNNFLMDGATNNDTFNTGFVLRPPPDAIQEFKILTHAFSAEYGRNAGSVVNVVTKSGSNTLSGSLWEFNRDDALNSRNYFAPQTQAKPELKQNQFGAAFGGPLLRNRLFGFGYYEGYRNDSGITQNVLVLSAAQRNGDFSGGAAIRDPLTGLPFDGNVIPAARISPAAAQLLRDFVPLPNAAGNRYITSPTVNDTRDQFGVRFDYQLGSRQSVLGRYMRSNTDRLTPKIIAPIDQRALATLQDGLVSHNFVISSSIINQARFSVNRISANPAVTSGLSPRSYGINFANTNPIAAGLPSIVVSGFFGGGNAALGDAQQPFVDRVNHVWQLADDMTWITGRHSLKFGGDIRREAMRIAFINRPNGDLTFSGGLTGNAAADFLLGFPAQARATTQQAIQEGYGWLFAGYAQDEFRITSRLTLNLGVRYELPTPFIDVNDAITGFRTGVQSQKYPAAPRGLVYPGDPDVPRGVVPTDKNNVAPRLAVAWDPQGDGRMSIRSAFGVFYDALAGQGDFFQSGVLSPPFTPLIELNTPTPITLADPLAAVAGPPNPFPAALTIIGWGDDFKSPYAYHFNAGVQRQLFEPRRHRSVVRRLTRVQPADLHGDQSRRVCAGADRARRAADAGLLAGPSDVPGGEIVVRLAAGQRAHAAVARPQLPRQLHARQDHRSRVGPQHRRRSAAGAAGRAGRRGEHRARARIRKRPGAVRRAASIRRQLRLRAADAREFRGTGSRHRRRVAIERHLPGADRIPVDRDTGHRARHPLHDVAAGCDRAIPTRARRRRRSGSTRRASPR